MVTKWLKLSFAADDPITQEDACPEDSNCPSECYCEGGTVDCSHRELKGKKKDGFYWKEAIVMEQANARDLHVAGEA